MTDTPTVRDFKPGDKVRILDSTSKSMVPEIASMIGQVCEVKLVYGGDLSVYDPNRRDFWYFHRHEVELVEAVAQ